MKYRKSLLVGCPIAVLISNLWFSFSLFGYLFACGESWPPCKPSQWAVDLFHILTFPISQMPKGLATFGLFSFVVNAAIWAMVTFGVLAILVRRQANHTPSTE